MVTRNARDSQPYRACLLRRFAQGVCLCLVSLSVSADDLFLPNTLSSSLDEERENLALQQLRSLSNDDLLEQAALLRSNEMTAEHRALNHQWLSIHAGECEEIKGSKVFSRIARKTFREYWRDKRRQLGDSKLIPDENGDINTKYNDIDYDFKISGGGLRIGFEYEFQ